MGSGGVCPELSSHNPLAPFITKDNVNEIVPNTFQRTPGSTVTVTCTEPLVLNGDSTFVCQDDLTWSYSFKPFCTSSPTSSEGLDEETKIIIGVVCGIAGLIIAILIIMVLKVWYRDRHRKGVRYEYWHDTRRKNSVNYKSGYRERDVPTSIDVDRFTRGTPPPPYRSDIDRRSDGKYRYYHGSYDDLSNVGSRRHGGPMYLPGSSPYYMDYFDEVRRHRRTGAGRYGDEDFEEKPYVREWLSRSESMLDKDYIDGPTVHGKYYEREEPRWLRYF